MGSLLISLRPPAFCKVTYRVVGKLQNPPTGSPGGFVRLGLGDFCNVTRRGLCNFREWGCVKFPVADGAQRASAFCNLPNSDTIRLGAVAAVDGHGGPVVQECKHMRCVMVHIDTVAGEDATPFAVGRGRLHVGDSIRDQIGQVGSKHNVTFQPQ